MGLARSLFLPCYLLPSQTAWHGLGLAGGGHVDTELGRRSAEPKQVLIYVVEDMEEVCMDAVAVSVVVPAPPPPPMCAANGAAAETPHFLSPTTARASARRPSFPKGPTCAWSWRPRSLGQEPAATMSRGHSRTMTKATTGVTRKSTAE